MPSLKVVQRDGTSRVVEGDAGLTVMKVIHDHGFADFLALCGGCRSCATCHVHVESAFLDKLPPMGDDENDLLDGTNHRQPNSRLSCQIPFSSELDGMEVTIAEED